MKHIIAGFVLLLGGMAAISARAAGHLAEVALIDRDTGERLEAYYHRGEYWVAGEPGARYAIYIRNRLNERLLAVTSVDGVNVITGQSAGWDQGGYVLDPWEDCRITGWRKSDYQVAAFAFTPAPRSYATRTGRPDNVGVIGIALFREQAPDAPPRPYSPPIAREAPEAEPLVPPSAPWAGRAQRDAEASAQAAPDSHSPDLSANAARNAPLYRAPALGTAHGEREYSYVAHTTFVRRQWRPDEIIRIRYDKLDHLIAMGIVRPHRHEGLRPDPFPSSDAPSYVPDPPPLDSELPR